MPYKFKIVRGLSESVEPVVTRLLNRGWEIVGVVDSSTPDNYHVQVCLVKYEVPEEEGD